MYTTLGIPWNGQYQTLATYLDPTISKTKKCKETVEQVEVPHEDGNRP